MSSKTKTTTPKPDGKPALTPKLRFPEFRDAAGWNLELLGGISQPQQWSTISSAELVRAGFPVYGANGFIGYYTDFNHEFETVAVTCRGSTCGEVLLIPAKSYITGNSMCLDGIDAAQNSYHFLYHLLKHRGFDDVISGSAQPQIVGNAIKRLKIPLPELKEQQKIAECLSIVDELMAAQARKLDALKTHKKGLMQQLFPREGETQPRLRFPEFQNAGEWVAKKLDQFAKYTKGFAFRSQDYKNEGVRIIRVSDLGADFIKANNEKIYISSGAEHEYERYKLKASEIIVTTVGSKPELVDSAVGRGIYVNSNNEGLLNQNLLKLEVLPGVNSRFLFSHINTPAYQKFIASISRGNANQANIAVKDLMGFIIKAPPPAEQQRLANCLTSLDDLIAVQTQKLDALKTHKKGLMQQLFPSPEAVEV